MLVCKTKALPTLIIASIAIWPNLISGQCPVAAKPGSQTAETIASHGPLQIKIQKIVFRGNTGLTPTEQADIVARVKDKVENYEPKWLEELEARLVDAWHERGYFKAQITAKAREVSSAPEGKTFVVTAQVESGRRYTLGEIRFLKSTQFSFSEMRSMFPLQTGELFNTHRIWEGLDELRKAYGSKGFVDFTPVPSTIYDEVHGHVFVEIDLEEGKQYRISEIKVLGLDPASAKALLQSSGLEPGSIFSWKVLEDFGQQHPLIQIERRIDAVAGKVSLQMEFPESNQAPSPQECNP